MCCYAPWSQQTVGYIRFSVLSYFWTYLNVASKHFVKVSVELWEMSISVRPESEETSSNVQLNPNYSIL